MNVSGDRLRLLARQMNKTAETNFSNRIYNKVKQGEDKQDATNKGR